MAGNIFAFLIFGLFVHKATANNVPVVIWTNDKAVHYPVSLTGHTLDTNSFYNGYLQQLQETGVQNFVVFVQDQLSVDDITRYGDVFNDESSGAAYQSLRTIMETHEAAFVPSVKEPVNAVDKLLEHFQGTPVFVDDSTDLDSLELHEDGGNFIIVTLPPTTTGRKLEALVMIDSIIDKLSKKMSALNDPFCAVYTAKARSQAPVTNVFKGRQLLAASDNSTTNYTFFNQSGCMYVYFQQMQLHVIRSTDVAVDGKFTLPAVGTHLAEGSCDNGTAMINYTFTDLPTDLDSFSMMISLSTHMRYWYISGWKISFSGKVGSNSFSGVDVELENNTNTIFGVVAYSLTSNTGRSYHCGNPLPIKQFKRSSTEDSIVQLLFTKLQLQYNITGATDHTFSKADDCIGFFTEAIWMGLIVTLLLIMILAFGVGMLANINTMDRFDDPKGKSIQVNAAE